jgi:hypothetical protein
VAEDVEVRPDPADDADWLAVEIFPSPSEASVADGALKAAGIPTRLLLDESGSAGGSAMPGEAGGAELQVPVTRIDEARTVLGGGAAPPATEA